MNNIRNFAIIAHIDHGKSTLADRFLEITGTVQKGKHEEQFLDQNPISRERGITIKLAPVRMNYQLKANNYMLNLIDTPGHMDFSYEVSRTLAACEGAILLVDATQGIQAQTVAHFQSAKSENLFLIPAINKIDLETARVSDVTNEMIKFFNFKKEEFFYISAKTGQNVENLLDAVIEKIPQPSGSIDSSFRALVFDASFSEHRGVIAFVKVVDGSIKKGERIKFLKSQTQSTVSEVGFFSPFLSEKENLEASEIGYIVTGIKDIRKARVGDTITILKIKDQKSKIEPLPGYKTPQPMVFFGVYPKEQNDLVKLKEALNKLSLNDASLTIDSEYSSYLGTGFRVGFLGLLHAEIIKERLSKEENIDPFLTKPQVLYRTDPSTGFHSDESSVHPETVHRERERAGREDILEPYMTLTVFVPKQYVGQIITVCESKKGNLVNMTYEEDNIILKYDMPFSMFIRGLTEDLKSASSGFASIDYTLSDWRVADLVNLEILINDNPVDVLSEFVYKDEVNTKGREKVDKLKELLPKQQFRQVIQAAVGGKIISRSEIPPFRKDVLAKMSGGDRTRKDKLLKKQKKGKSKMQRMGRIDIPQNALFSLIK